MKEKCINKKCWLVKNLGYSPAERCQYCELMFHQCLFFQYLVVSLTLTFSLFVLSFLIKGEISRLLVVSVFILVIIYGYFFNKSTDKIIKANFEGKKAREILEDLSKNLQEKVGEQTKELRESKEQIERAYHIEKRAHEELKRVDEAKNQFIMATQHHLRTPLTSMHGYLDLLLEGSFGKVPPKIKEILLKFKASTKNEIKIVEELLNISQIRLGKKIVVFSSGVKIDFILKGMIEELKPEAEKKGIYLKLKKPPEKLPEIKADQSKLKMALLNIIDNAVKYTEKGGVLIEIIAEDSKLRIIVKDTGIGINNEEAKNLFNRIFERSEKAQKLFTVGRGIGLYISAKIIEAHDGRIWAESEGPGKGSAFYIELPA